MQDQRARAADNGTALRLAHRWATPWIRQDFAFVRFAGRVRFPCLRVRCDDRSKDPAMMDAPMASTLELLDRVKQGDKQALDLLVERSLPPLERWARGRLPRWARGLAETQDLVQDAVIGALPRLSTFEAHQPGALQAYLRQAVTNRIQDEIRKVQERTTPAELHESSPDPDASPLEQAVGREGLERYDAALARLRPADREAIIARLELQQSYEEVALALGKPSAAAARMAVTRAVKALVRAMNAQ
jgi:RNA polymerase sigma-70 factor, ECF subfamily